MELAVFDIDGTLTETSNQYDEYYARAVEGALCIPKISRSWTDYSYSTDSGIMHEACLRALCRPPRAEEVIAAQQFYVEKLGQTLTGARIVPGALEILGTLQSSEWWAVALATGNWKRPAELIDLPPVLGPPEGWAPSS